MTSKTSLSRRSFLIAAAAGIPAATVLSSCASTVAQTAAAPSEASSYFFDRMAARNATVSSVHFDTELADWLPNQQFEVEGEAARPLGAGLATGTVEEVVGGRGYIIDKSEESGEVVPFNAPDALWRTIDVTMRVTKSWGEVSREKAVRFGIAFGGTDDHDLMIASVNELKVIVAAFLGQGFFRHQPSLYRVGRNGLLLGTVDGSGRLHFPGLKALDDDVDLEKAFLSGTLTTEDLDSEAEKKRPTIRVKGGERL